MLCFSYSENLITPIFCYAGCKNEISSIFFLQEKYKKELCEQPVCGISVLTVAKKYFRILHYISFGTLLLSSVILSNRKEGISYEKEFESRISTR